jgi:hypothetical protein
MTGEEDSQERAFAFVETATDRQAYELSRVGRMRFENVYASPLEQLYTVAFTTDDNQDGVLQVYIGTKQATGKSIKTRSDPRLTFLLGTPLERAGLTNGRAYYIVVNGMSREERTSATSAKFTTIPAGVDGITVILAAPSVAFSLSQLLTYSHR